MADAVLAREQLPIAAHVDDEAPQGDNAGCFVQQPPDAEHLSCHIALNNLLGDQRVLETARLVLVLLADDELAQSPVGYIGPDHRGQVCPDGVVLVGIEPSQPLAPFRAVGFKLRAPLGRHIALGDQEFVVVVFHGYWLSPQSVRVGCCAQHISQFSWSLLPSVGHSLGEGNRPHGAASVPSDAGPQPRSSPATAPRRRSARTAYALHAVQRRRRHGVPELRGSDAAAQRVHDSVRHHAERDRDPVHQQSGICRRSRSGGGVEARERAGGRGLNCSGSARALPLIGGFQALRTRLVRCQFRPDARSGFRILSTAARHLPGYGPP